MAWDQVTPHCLFFPPQNSISGLTAKMVGEGGGGPLLKERGEGRPGHFRGATGQGGGRWLLGVQGQRVGHERGVANIVYYSQAYKIAVKTERISHFDIKCRRKNMLTTY